MEDDYAKYLILKKSKDELAGLLIKIIEKKPEMVPWIQESLVGSNIPQSHIIKMIDKEIDLGNITKAFSLYRLFIEKSLAFNEQLNVSLLILDALAPILSSFSQEYFASLKGSILFLFSQTLFLIRLFGREELSNELLDFLKMVSFDESFESQLMDEFNGYFDIDVDGNYFFIK